MSTYGIMTSIKGMVSMETFSIFCHPFQLLNLNADQHTA